MENDATELVKSLLRAPNVKHTNHTVQAGTSHHHLVSWKLDDWAYKTMDLDRRPPTLARGLFTEKERVDTQALTHGGRGAPAISTHRIAIRGYDKFFNLNEVPWTRRTALARYAAPPLEVTVKENGCLIFIAALASDALVVTSKHALGDAGARGGTSHAQKGEEWLERHLAVAGRTKAALAQRLWEDNVTAVTELCDDRFEEHVLPYAPERTGLHLHGLNFNTVDFATQRASQVAAFALEWGFIPPRFLIVPTHVELDAFAAEAARTGTFEGAPVEGFVVRTHMPPASELELEPDTEGECPPYAPGQPWFFKIKHEQPYLMYREWRELARHMLKGAKDADRRRPKPARGGRAARGAPPPHETDLHAEEQVLPRARSGLAESRMFVHWCARALREHRGLFAGFEKSHGVFRVRAAFLEYLETEEGRAALEEERRVPARGKSSRSG